MQIASFSPPPPLLFPRPRFAVHCLASRGLGGAATCSLHFFTFVPLSHCLPIGVPIVRSLARPPSPPQHKSVPGHSRHSTDAPNNDPLWKLPPICYLNSETASEVRKSRGQYIAVAVGSIKVYETRQQCFKTPLQGEHIKKFMFIA